MNTQLLRVIAKEMAEARLAAQQGDAEIKLEAIDNWASRLKLLAAITEGEWVKADDKKPELAYTDVYTISLLAAQDIAKMLACATSQDVDNIQCCVIEAMRNIPVLEWGHIDTAPKDGTTVLTCWRGADYKLNYFNTMADLADSFKLGREQWWYSAADKQPTHWLRFLRFGEVGRIAQMPTIDLDYEAYNVIHNEYLKAYPDLPVEYTSNDIDFDICEIIKNSASVKRIDEGDWVRADDVNRLVRELDVALNGEAGAAEQAALCDIVSHVKSQGWKLVNTSTATQDQEAWVKANDAHIASMAYSHLHSVAEKITIERSPEMFPQATYDVCTAGLRSFSMALIDAYNHALADKP
jgi:hypothetical protein